MNPTSGPWPTACCGAGAIGLAVALVCLAWGANACLSALAGALTGVIANLYMTFRALEPARSPRRRLDGCTSDS